MVITINSVHQVTSVCYTAWLALKNTLVPESIKILNFFPYQTEKRLEIKKVLLMN